MHPTTVNLLWNRWKNLGDRRFQRRGTLLEWDRANTGDLRWRCLLPWIASAIWLAAPELLAHMHAKSTCEKGASYWGQCCTIDGVWKLLRAAIPQQLINKSDKRYFCCEDLVDHKWSALEVLPNCTIPPIGCEDTLQNCIGLILSSQRQPIEK